MSGGKAATVRSQALVDSVVKQLESYRLIKGAARNFRQLREFTESLLPGSPGAYAENVYVCPSVTGANWKARLAVYKPGWETPVGIDIRGQAVSGSTGVKMEYVLATIREMSPWPFFVILDGSGWSPGVVKRAMYHASKSSGLMRVMRSFSDISIWLDGGMEYPKWSRQPSGELFTGIGAIVGQQG